MNRREWRARFTKRVRERDEAARALKKSQDELSEMGSKTAGWNLGTPGTAAEANPETPLSFELNQRIRREKRDLADAESKLETLKVEANLAHVPEAWREPFETERAETSETGDDHDDW